MVPQEMFQERISWRARALRVELAFLRADLALRAYNPGQLRVPAGNPEGGRWTTGDQSKPNLTDADAPLILVADNDDPRYHVRLEEEEGYKNGHTIRGHVGRSDDDMFARVQKSINRTLLCISGIRRDGSFFSVDSANDLVNRTIANNLSLVDQVATGSLGRKFITSNFDFKTGREAYSTNDGVVFMRDTFSVGVELRHDPTRSRGYRVHTAYPRVDGD